MEHLVLLLISFILGLILSWLSSSFLFVLLFITYSEMLIFCVYYGTDEWDVCDRVSYISCNLFGWVIGRTLHHRRNTYFYTEEFDKDIDI